MVWTNYVSKVFIQTLFIVYFIKHSGRIKDKMGPHLFQPEYFWEPLFTAEQNQKNRVK